MRLRVFLPGHAEILRALENRPGSGVVIDQKNRAESSIDCRSAGLLSGRAMAVKDCRPSSLMFVTQAQKPLPLPQGKAATAF
jgi:hypothetical protein